MSRDPSPGSGGGEDGRGGGGVPHIRTLDGRYHVTRVLGSGGMGTVVEAEHLVLGRRCAIKLLRRERRYDPHSLARFRTEAELLARLEHPNVVAITDFGVDQEQGGIPYLVMEYVEGQTLRDELERHGPLDVERAVAILAQVAGAVDAAHRSGIVHGDLKPDNVMIRGTRQARPWVTLLDLGLARVVRHADAAVGQTAPRIRRGGAEDAEGRTATAGAWPGCVGGTRGYMAPELLAGQPPSPASDRWSFAVLAHELLTGRRPDEGRPVAAGGGTTSGKAARDLSEELRAPLTRALGTDPARRPATAMELVRELVAVEHRGRLEAWKGRQRARRLILSVVVCILAAAAGWMAGSSRLHGALEGVALDQRFRIAGSRRADPRIVMVELDDQTLATDPQPLVAFGDRVGRALDRALDGGAIGVGIDILLPPQWGSQEGFVQLLLNHPDRVVLAAHSTADGVLGGEVATGVVTVALGRQRAAALFAPVTLPGEPGSVIRWLQRSLPDAAGGRQLTFAARLARLVRDVDPAPGRWVIDHRVDPDSFRRVGLTDLERDLEADGHWATGLLLLVGATFAGAGDSLHEVPRTPGGGGATRGLAVQALMVDTLISPEALRTGSGRIPVLAAALGAVPLAWLLLWSGSGRTAAAAAGALAVGLIGSDLAWFCLVGVYRPLVGAACTLLVAGSAGWALRLLLSRRPAPLHISVPSE